MDLAGLDGVLFLQLLKYIVTEMQCNIAKYYTYGVAYH